MTKKLFDNKTDYAILAFIVGVALMLGYCEVSQADWSVEYTHDSNAGATGFNDGLDQIGGRYTYNSGASLYFSPLLSVGGEVVSGSFQIGIADQWGRYEVQLNMNRLDEEMDGGFTARRLIGDGSFKLSIGGSYWINESPGSNSNITFNLGMRYEF